MGRHRNWLPASGRHRNTLGRRRAPFSRRSPEPERRIVPGACPGERCGNQAQAIPADRHTCTEQAVEGLGDESLLLEPLRPEYAVVLVVDVDAYETAVLNQPVTAPSLEYPAGCDARQVAFNPLADLLVGGRAESDDRFLEFGSLEPLYQVNIAKWFLREVVLEHGDPDLREFRGIRTDCLSFRIPIVIFVFFHVRIIF